MKKRLAEAPTVNSPYTSSPSQQSVFANEEIIYSRYTDKGHVEEYIKIWTTQGRTEEQIWAVKNFMTGQGQLMVEDLIEKAKEEEQKRLIKHFERTRTLLKDKITEDMHISYQDLYIVIASLKGEKESKK